VDRLTGFPQQLNVQVLQFGNCNDKLLLIIGISYHIFFMGEIGLNEILGNNN